MRVVIRLKHGPAVRRKRHKNQQAALIAALFLTPAAVMACALALWRIAADMGMAGAFPLTSGIFSHWQVWFVIAAVLQTASLFFSRYGNAESEDLARSEVKSDPPVRQAR